VIDVKQATPRDPWRSKRNPMRTEVSKCALGAGCASGTLSALGAVGLVLGACTASSEDVRPPEDKLYFPTGLAIDHDGTVLFVANANSELRYDSGSIGVIDLKLVDDYIKAWAPADPAATPDARDCTPDLDRRETLVCDAAKFFTPGAGVRIGNFATDIAVQEFSAPGAATKQLRVLVPTRGDPSIAWADYVDKRLSCSSASGFALCDDAHRLTVVNNDPAQSAIADEPFGVFADAANGFAIVTHLSAAAITLIDSPSNGNAVVTDIQPNLFASDPSTGIRAATAVAGRIPQAGGDDIVYVGSRTDDRIQTLTVARPLNHAPPYLVPGAFFFLDSVGKNSGSSVDTRDLQFSPGDSTGAGRGERMYLVNRAPPSLQVFDTSVSAGGAPLNRPSGGTDICRQASKLTVVDIGGLERVYVTCFQDGALYAIDPSGVSQVEDIITVGRGPYAVVASVAQQRLFVSNFLEDTVAVVDVNPISPTHNRVVLRIGKPRAQ